MTRLFLCDTASNRYLGQIPLPPAFAIVFQLLTRSTVFRFCRYYREAENCMQIRVNNYGYTLVELVITLVIIGILATVAMRSLRTTNEVAKTEKTKQALERIAQAIVGTQSSQGGTSGSTDGYLGDVGALPPNLDALVTNPGGYSSWRGPYITDQFSLGGAPSIFKQDGWGSSIGYSGGLTLTSNGGGTTLTRELASNLNDLLRNQINAVVVDAGRTPPGPLYKDSLRVQVVVPNGVGGWSTKTKYPNANGEVVFDSIPVGLHDVRAIYLPSNDTLRRKLAVVPGSSPYVELTMPQELW